MNKHQHIVFVSIFIRRITIVFFCLSSIATTNNAQICFDSEKLKEVFGLLPEQYRKEIEKMCSIPTGSHLMEASLFGEKYTLIYRFNQYHELDHIGIYLINGDQDFMHIRELFDYLERAFLISTLHKDSYPFMQEVKEKQIEVFYNGISINEPKKLTFFSKIAITKDTPFKGTCNSDFFLIEWALDSTNRFNLKIPNNYSLITKKTKEELEQDLLRKLKLTVDVSVNKERPEANLLKRLKNNIYELQGDFYSSQKGLSSSKYFLVKNSICPVFQSKYYKESIHNLFLNMIPTVLDINMIPRVCGKKEEEFRININRFFSNFSSDYTVFFGWQNEDRDNLKATILFFNKVFKYNHLLEITSSTEAIFQNNGKIKGVFYSYIPR